MAAYRVPYLLAGGSLLLKMESQYREHFYRHLEPFRHYIPVRGDLSDLTERVEWARQNDAQAKTIAENAVRISVFPEKYSLELFPSYDPYAWLVECNSFKTMIPDHQ